MSSLPGTSLPPIDSSLPPADIRNGDAKAKQAKLDPELFNGMKTDLMSRSRGEQTRSAAIWNLLQEKVAAATTALKSYFRNRFDQNSRPFAHPYYWSGFVYTGS